MPPPTACPGAAPLRQLLQGQVGAADAARLEQHIGDCPQCLRRLAEMAGDLNLIAAASGQAAEARALHPVLSRLYAKVTAAKAAAAPPSLVNTGTGFDTNAGPSLAAEAPDDTSYCLAPAHGPGEMGRLGGYRVLRVLGVGGMGTVYEAEDPTLRRRVALKTMRPAVASQPGARDRFLREARAAAALNHDHVVAIYQVGEDRGVPFLAMPLLHGEMLEGRLRRVGRLPLPEALRVARETAEGLAVAHDRGIIHRDIKPGNVWLEAPGDRVKILDFGLASGLEGDAQLTSPGAILGTPAYMAPEQAGGVVDHRADLFSLGCMLYRMATGRMPFAGAGPMEVLRNIAVQEPRRPRELNPEIAAPLDQFILRLLAKEREQRPVSAAVVARVLTTLEQQIANTVVHPPAAPLAVPLAPGQRPAAPPPVAQLVQPAPAPKAPPSPNASPQIQAAPPPGALAPRQIQIAPAAAGPLGKWLTLPMKTLPSWFQGLSTWHKALVGGSVAAVVLGVFLIVGVALLWRGPPGTATQTAQGPPGAGDKDKTPLTVTGPHGAPQVILPSPGRIPTPPIAVGEALNSNSIVTRPAKIERLTTWDLISDQITSLTPGLTFLRDGRLDIYDSGVHFLWDFEQGGVAPAPFGGSYSALAPDLSSCARINGQAVPLFDKDNPDIARTLLTGGVSCAAWSNGGQYLATYGAEGVCVWDADHVRRLMAWAEDPMGNFTGQLVWAPDDQSVVAWLQGSGSSVFQIDVTKPQARLLHRVQVEGRVRSARLQPQGDVIAVHCLDDAIIRIYDLKSESKLHPFPDRASGVLAWSPDGKLLAFGVGAGVQVWDCESWNEPRLLYTLDKPRQRSLALVFAPHGDTLFSYDADGKMRLWEVQTGQLRGTIVFLAGGHWLAVTPEGHYRASPGAENAELFRYQAIEGKTRDLKPKDFANRYGWVNDPDKPLKALR